MIVSRSDGRIEAARRMFAGLFLYVLAVAGTYVAFVLAGILWSDVAAAFLSCSPCAPDNQAMNAAASGLGAAATVGAAALAGTVDPASALADNRIADERERLRQARAMRDPRNSPGAVEAYSSPGGTEVYGAPDRPGTGGRPTSPPAPATDVFDRIKNDRGVRRYGPSDQAVDEWIDSFQR